MRPIATIVLLLAIAPASAQAQWEPVAPPAGEYAPDVAFGDSGRALIVSHSGSAPEPVATHLASWRPPAPPGREVRRLPGLLVDRPVRLGRNRVLLVTESAAGTGPYLHATVVGVSGRVLQRRQRIRGYEGHYAHALAASPRGEAALAWAEPVVETSDLEGRLRLRLAVRPRGGRFRLRSAIELGADDHPGPAAVALAYASGGRLVLAFTTERTHGRRQVHALIGRPGRWRRQVLGLHRGISDIVAAADPRGRVVVAWQTQDGGEEANRPSEVRAAILEPRAAAFTRTRLLDDGDGIGRWPGSLAAAAGRDGALALTWSQVRAEGSYPLVVASAPPRGGFSPPQVLDPNGAAGDLRFAPDGRLLVSWSRITHGNYQGPDQAFTAQRGPGAPEFGAPEALSEDVGATPPALAFDPASGRFVASWSLVPRYPDTGPSQPRLAIRAR